MKHNFLRPPATLAEWIADALRALGIVGILVAAIWFTPTDAGIIALALPALMVPRVLGLRAWFDIVLQITVLVAAWSNVFDLYTSVAGWDLLLHLVCTAALAALLYIALARMDITADLRRTRRPARRPIVLAVSLALAISAVWEMIEWLGWTYVSDDIFVTYTDTIGDMVFGGLGGLGAGILLAFVALERDDSHPLPR